MSDDDVETWEHLHDEHEDAFLECLEGPEGCAGAVEYRPVPPRGERAFPRCELHSEQRWARYDDPDSIERWADSDVPPPWFDPSAAGERWEDD